MHNANSQMKTERNREVNKNRPTHTHTHLWMHKKLAVLPVSEFPHTFSFSTLALINHKFKRSQSNERCESEERQLNGINKSMRQRQGQPEFAGVLCIYNVHACPFAIYEWRSRRHWGDDGGQFLIWNSRNENIFFVWHTIALWTSTRSNLPSCLMKMNGRCVCASDANLHTYIFP